MKQIIFVFLLVLTVSCQSKQSNASPKNDSLSVVSPASTVEADKPVASKADTCKIDTVDIVKIDTVTVTKIVDEHYNAFQHDLKTAKGDAAADKQKLAKYIHVEGHQCVLSISRDEAKGKGISEKVYDDTTHDLNEINLKIREDAKKAEQELGF